MENVMIEYFKIQMEKNKTLTQDDIEFFIKRRLDKTPNSKDGDEIRDYYQSKLGKKQLFYMLYDTKKKELTVLTLFEDEMDTLKDLKYEAMREMMPKFIKK